MDTAPQRSTGIRLRGQLPMLAGHIQRTGGQGGRRKWKGQVGGGWGEWRGSIWARVWREEGLVLVPLEEKMYWIAALKSNLSPSC